MRKYIVFVLMATLIVCALSGIATAEAEFYVTDLEWGSWGPGDGQFSYPSGVAVDNEGNVYVADVINQRIQKFTTNGSFITTWGGEFNNPYDVAVNNVGNVYVADTNNCRIKMFTANGTVITSWGGGPYSSDGLFNLPNGVAVDNEGYVYVADTHNNRIQKFNATGSFITKWGSEGYADGQFRYPKGVAVNDAGNVYVSSFYTHRIQKFSFIPLCVTQPNGGENWVQGSKQNIRWEYLGDPGSSVRIDVMNGSNVLATIPAVPAGSGGNGSHNLTLPYNAPLGTDFRVRVTSTSNATFTDTSNNPFTIAPAITVISPDGGENYMQGSPQTINWTYTGNPGPTVKIEAMSGETVLAVISPAMAIGSDGQGSFNLTFPYHTPLGSEYRIRITSTTYPGCTDTSNAPFSVVPNTSASITLVSPDGGENYLQGSKQTITWTYNGYPGPTVKIEALRGETVLAVITPATAIGSAGSGSFNLTFPYNTPLGSDYRIRVSSTIYPSWTDTSENPFTISPAITVVSPNGGSYPLSSILPMGWTYAGNPGGTVNIDVIKGSSTLKTLTGIPIGSGGSGWYNVTIPASTPTGGDYRIRVTSAPYPACTDTSDLDFAIG